MCAPGEPAEASRNLTGAPQRWTSADPDSGAISSRRLHAGRTRTVTEHGHPPVPEAGSGPTPEPWCGEPVKPVPPQSPSYGYGAAGPWAPPQAQATRPQPPSYPGYGGDPPPGGGPPARAPPPPRVGPGPGYPPLPRPVVPDASGSASPVWWPAR